MKSNGALTMQNWVPQAEKKKRSLKVKKLRRKDTLQRSSRRIPRLFICLFLCVSMVVGIAYLLQWVQQQRSSLFTIESVKIEGDINESQAREIELLLTPYLKGDFFKINLKTAREAIMSLSWVRDADIRRQWPNSIWVDILAQQPVAIWNGGAYLNSVSEVYSAKVSTNDGSAKHLPELYGIDGSQSLVFDYYQRFVFITSPLQLKIVSVVYDERGSWRLEFDNGMKIMLGYQELMPRLQRFVRVYHAYFMDQPNSIDAVDLRYSNGLTVRWNDKHRTDVSIRS